MFQTIDIQGFRGFGELTLDGLGRVNLIVGKNNTGKTSLLEALTLLANPGMIDSLPSLFRPSSDVVGGRFFRWLPRDGARNGESMIRAAINGSGGNQILFSRNQKAHELPPGFVLAASPGGVDVWKKPGQTTLRLHAVSVQHKSPDEMIDAFAEAVRSPRDEQQMESLLASVDPRIRSIRLDSVKTKPFIVVDLGLSERVPIAQAGQGIYRLVAIFSELLGHKPDICLIDEIENGIHYSAQPKVWAGIAEIAARLDIQVFATTHSWECLLAAHEVFAARDPYDLRVIQLYSPGGTISGRVLDREHIEAAIAGEIELR